MKMGMPLWCDSSHPLQTATAQKLSFLGRLICAGEKIGHELLTIIIRFALILVSTLDPAS